MAAASSSILPALPADGGSEAASSPGTIASLLASLGEGQGARAAKGAGVNANPAATGSPDGAAAPDFARTLFGEGKSSLPDGRGRAAGASPDGAGDRPRARPRPARRRRPRVLEAMTVSFESLPPVPDRRPRRTRPPEIRRRRDRPPRAWRRSGEFSMPRRVWGLLRRPRAAPRRCGRTDNFRIGFRRRAGASCAARSARRSKPNPGPLRRKPCLRRGAGAREAPAPAGPAGERRRIGRAAGRVRRHGKICRSSRD